MMRAQITTLAHALRKNGLTWAGAMKRAWAAIRLKLSMANHAVGFWYTKENGDERYAIGFNAVAPTNGSKPKAPKVPSPLVIVYFDLFVNDWRSFRADRLILD